MRGNIWRFVVKTAPSTRRTSCGKARRSASRHSPRWRLRMCCESWSPCCVACWRRRCERRCRWRWRRETAEHAIGGCRHILACCLCGGERRCHNAELRRRSDDTAVAAVVDLNSSGRLSPSVQEMLRLTHTVDSSWIQLPLEVQLPTIIFRHQLLAPPAPICSLRLPPLCGLLGCQRCQWRNRLHDNAAAQRSGRHQPRLPW